MICQIIIPKYIRAKLKSIRAEISAGGGWQPGKETGEIQSVDLRGRRLRDSVCVLYD
jgi:hypothetical protein